MKASKLMGDSDQTDSLDRSSPLAVAWKKGKTAAWINRWPGLCLWGFGVGLIASYYSLPVVQEFLESLGRLKTYWGWRFSVVSTALFGGVLPMVLPLVFGRRIPKHFVYLFVSNTVFWALKGLEIDWFYQLQAWLLGDDSNWQTVAVKVLVDQTLYAPLVGLLNCVLFYIWRDNGFSISRTRESLGSQWYVKKVLPALISNWCVWLPSVIIIYCLPLPLQLPVQNLILCFWVLVLVFFTDEDESEECQNEKGQV